MFWLRNKKSNFSYVLLSGGLATSIKDYFSVDFSFFMEANYELRSDVLFPRSSLILVDSVYNIDYLTTYFEERSRQPNVVMVG